MNDAKSAVSGPINEIKRVVTDAWNSIKQVTSDTWGKFSQTVSDNIKKALDAVGRIKDAVVNAVKDAGTWLLNAGKSLVQGFIDGINSKLSALRAKVQEMTDLTKKHTAQELQAKSPSQVFMQYGRDVVQGFIDGIDKLFPGLRAKLQEFTDLVQKIAKEKLKIGSPSKIFEIFGVDTMQGFINGLMSKIPEIQGIFDQLKAQFPEIQKAAADAASRFGVNFTGNIADAVRQVQGSSDKIKNAIKDVFLTGDLRGQLSDALGVDIMEDSPLVDGILSLRDKIMSSGGSLKNAVQGVVDKFTPVAQKLIPIGDKIVSALKPLPDKIKPIADAVKSSVQQISSQLPRLSDLLDRFDLNGLMQKLKPLAPTLRGLAQSGDLQGIANLVPQVAPGLPRITVNPAQVNGAFPDKITLKVGDREFNAYVDERADALLSQAASLLSRGRK
jgi:phage-related protein